MSPCPHAGSIVGGEIVSFFLKHELDGGTDEHLLNINFMLQGMQG